MNPRPATAPDVIQRIADLENIAGRDLGERGIAPLLEATRGDLLGAATSLAQHPAPHVAILTGFYIPTADPPAAENDGPIGAVHLAAALERAGIASRLVTDEPCAGALRAAATAAGYGGEMEVVPLDAKPTAWEKAEPAVSHVVAIERVGPSADGACRNMRGDDISPWTAPLHHLFQPDSGRIRIGIGDGGNELGMGKLPPDLVAARGDRAACVTDCDYLLVCGVSNWGALSLALALALLRPDLRATLTSGLSEERDRQVLEAVMHQGPAVDGRLRHRALSVDNLPWNIHAGILRDLLDVLP